jgi:hypothetical protein
VPGNHFGNRRCWKGCSVWKSEFGEDNSEYWPIIWHWVVLISRVILGQNRGPRALYIPKSCVHDPKRKLEDPRPVPVSMEPYPSLEQSLLGIARGDIVDTA